MVSGEDMTAAQREKLEEEVSAFSKEREAYWKARADAMDWNSVKADLEVYVLAGEKVTSDPKRTEEYRDKVAEGLRLTPSADRPGLAEEDFAAIVETIRRKAAGFWVEGTARTTVRKFANDCVPTGPPVASQPHALRGESAQWVDDRLGEEVSRGQLVRGSSAWGSPPLPTKEVPARERARKRRLVVDYRRVNARVKRSMCYCRRASDVLAAAIGSIWFTFVDAVSGFNQIRNARRAREVLAIVSRSGKFLPMGLTFGPVNGPDDYNYVIDRAYAPEKGRRLRFTREWIAYVDDLTVRAGRVVDGRFLTDAQAEAETRSACKKGALASPQSPGSALKALGFDPAAPKRARQSHDGTGAAAPPGARPKHDEKVSDHNHPARVLALRLCFLCLLLFALLLLLFVPFVLYVALSGSWGTAGPGRRAERCGLWDLGSVQGSLCARACGSRSTGGRYM